MSVFRLFTRLPGGQKRGRWRRRRNTRQTTEKGRGRGNIYAFGHEACLKNSNSSSKTQLMSDVGGGAAKEMAFFGASTFRLSPKLERR